MKKVKYINIVMYYCMFTLGIYISSYQAIFNSIVRDYNFSAVMGGALITSHFVGSFSMPLFFGEIADRIGKKKVLIFSTIIFMLFVIIIFFFSFSIILFMSIFMIGGVFAVIEGIGCSELSIHNPNKVQSVMNLSQMFLCIGCVIGPLMAKLTENIFYGWRNVYILVFLALVIFLILLIYMKNDNKSIDKIEKTPYTFRLIKTPFIVVSALVIMAYVGVEEGYAFWIVSYINGIVSIHGLSTLALSTYWLMMGIGRLIASRVQNNHFKLLAGGMIISLFSVAAIFLFTSASAVVLLILFGLTGFGFSAIWPILVADTVEMYPQYAATTAGIMMTSSASGAAILPFIMGLVANGAGIRYAFVCIIITIALMLLSLIWLSPMMKRKKCQGDGSLDITSDL